MSNRNYTAEHHERAFNVWYNAGTYTAVNKELGIDYFTTKSWAGPFACKYACPWHNWEKLKSEKAAALNAQMDLYQKGITDPLVHDSVIREAVAGVPSRGYGEGATPTTVEDRQRAVATVVRSDLERLSQWEYLYTKVFFEITGLTLDARLLVRDGVPMTEEEIKEKLGKGCSCRTLDAGIRALTMVQTQIEELKKNLGAYGKSASSTPDEPKLETQARSLSIEDVRKFRTLMANTSPDQRELLSRMFQSEEYTFEHIDVAAEPVVA